MNNNDYFTLKGYVQKDHNELSYAMEDYLEMIYRLLNEQTVVRIGQLSAKLNVKPSSCSKIVQLLKESGYIDYEKYGYIALTEKGQTDGSYLLYRHNVLQQFLCTLNHSPDELEQVEKIEHFLNKTTIENLRELTIRMQEGEK